jgi:glycosyltransferase involved in cell wall biosynthesis/SAM-dependent methyltransferase
LIETRSAEQCHREPPLASGRPAQAGQFSSSPVSVPRISVVITCFNQAAFLAEAIESVLNQTVPATEIILVDDGSTDETARVAAAYPTICYRSQNNQGLSSARNSGIRAASGDFLVFLDADDRLLPTALESGLRCFEAYPDCAFVSGQHRRIDRHGAVISLPERIEIGTEPYLDFLRGNYIGMHSTVMYRHWVFDVVGGYDTALRASEDYEFYLRVARRCRVAQHDDLVAEYRRHSQNMSNDLDLMLASVLSVLRSQAEHIGDDQRRRDALNAGLEIWKDHYARLALTDAPKKLRLRQVRLIIWAAFRLLRRPPDRMGSKVYGRVRRSARGLVQAVIPKMFRNQLIRRRTGGLDLGDLRRTKPIARQFGFLRGRPVDRYYIERFLEQHAGDVHGRVLEIGDDSYTRRYGGGRVTRSEVLHAIEGNPKAAFVADLASADQIPSNIFDCVILAQTLHLIYDVQGAVRTVHRILKPGGVLLLTVPGISQLDEFGRPEDNVWGHTWYWGFTSLSARRACEAFFGESMVHVESHGNVLAAVAFLHGLAAHELTCAELDDHDPLYQLVITARAIKRRHL